MNPEKVAEIRLECMKIAQQYSSTKEELLKNTAELIAVVLGKI